MPYLGLGLWSYVWNEKVCYCRLLTFHARSVYLALGHYKSSLFCIRAGCALNRNNPTPFRATVAVSVSSGDTLPVNSPSSAVLFVVNPSALFIAMLFALIGPAVPFKIFVSVTLSIRYAHKLVDIITHYRLRRPRSTVVEEDLSKRHIHFSRFVSSIDKGDGNVAII